MTSDTPLPRYRLLLLRHAKSAWPDGVEDHDRPLGGRGLKAAPSMGRYMAREGLVPDLALISTARRTQETWALVGAELPDDIARRDVGEIYEAAADRIAAVVRGVDASVRTLLVVGHNPGLQELAIDLVADGERLAGVREKFPTGALAVIDFAVAWGAVTEGSGVLERFVVPRSLVG
ncbi:SixA phosphatase family protein [Rhizobium metallidurans]|uniref:Phosphohistidine phosphatase n=1 Tax=Rhizobium metallidurans TaxID=1265931 RepID=A0A7W6D2T2_9HYPH|nr:histidine phosphatase family protein [Rhizobium metallidurans]MBB3967161.1 phosphohistidine phosphatase [Rhizobium metallidurans]